ncbi:ubiquitin-conjugating enzyme E2 variant 3-like [Solea senegalensis]|uniref:Ubiquitin-conjugating enzyme E2 variant 3-like n=1 Tax=Solea senegalensis TaxID=28829 RepID=A0AAV6T280_SOLSE|nr:ubiquitin-conjugating enzyme E2 variant 3 [Solea senegalensis]KAG7523461.1 ubiquitin-conjugating enzyme E2 variant 3-like [Solea senegalensis]
MDLSSDQIKRILSKYKFHDVAIEELQKIHRIYPGIKPSPGTYTFSDGTQKDLLKLSGNIPVRYEGHSYNFPIQLWLIDSFPFTPPICYLKPTKNMAIREGKHVDAKGRLHLPALHNWDHPKSSVVVLLNEMIAKFEEDPPLCSKPKDSDKDPHELLAYVNKIQINDGGVRNHDQQPHKVSVIGGGDLGMASVMSILAKCKVDKLVVIDIAESSTKGGSTDLDIFSLPKVEVSRDLSASAGSRVVVVTANAWSSEQSYLGLVQTNADLFRRIVPNLARLSPTAVMLVASQPVDIMTHVAWRQSGFPPTRVIGAGCNLDSERLSHVLDIHLNTHKTAWVIGELSNDKVAVMSNMALGSNAQPEIAPGSNITKPLLDRAFEMIKNQGQRSWSVGLSVADITNSVLENTMKTHSVSTLAQGWGGIGTEVFLSLPCILGCNGSTRLAGVSLGKEEDSKLRDSVASLSDLMGQLRI